MMILVLDDAHKLDDVLAAWQDIGVIGVTILETTGAFRRTQIKPIHGRYFFGAAPQQSTPGNFTLMVILPDLAAVKRCEVAAEAVVGNLDDPNTGILAAWELAHTKGIVERNGNGLD